MINVLEALKSTSHSSDQRLIECRSVFMISAALSGVSTIIYKLVSSANIPDD